jgi:hypothetical protein
MGSWMHGLQILTKSLLIFVSVFAFVGALVVLWNRKRIEEMMRTRPYPEQPWRRFWIITGLNVSLLLALEFIVPPHLGIRLSRRTQVFLGIATTSLYVPLVAAFFSVARRIPTWSLRTRLRTMYVMLVFACILAFASLYHVFSHR